MLIKSYHERMQKSEEKKRKILNFLRDETWSTLKNITYLLGSTKHNAFRTLTIMQRDNLLISHKYKGLGGKFSLFGITSHGLAMSYEEEEEEIKRNYFEPSKVSIGTVNHTLDIQFARIKAEKYGWTEWINGKYLSDKNPLKRPDAIAISPENKKIAIEIERTIKTKKRYEQVMLSYLQSLKKGEYEYVVYLSPSEIFKNLERRFRQINEVVFKGHKIEIKDNHHNRFKFFDIEEWLVRETKNEVENTHFSDIELIP